MASNGPAARAGIQQGDTITSVNGTSITDAQGLLQFLSKEKPGDTISVTLDRNGSTVHVQVHLAELPG
jgi:S1-C subfamily serine protease